MPPKETEQLIARIKILTKQFTQQMPSSYQEALNLLNLLATNTDARNIDQQLEKITLYLYSKYAEQTITKIDDANVQYADGITFPIGITYSQDRLNAKRIGLHHNKQCALNNAVATAARQLTALQHLRIRPTIASEKNMHGYLLPEFFNHYTHYKFSSKPCIASSRAIKEVFDYNGEELFFIDCTIARQLITYKACLDILGEEEFNDVFPWGIRLSWFAEELEVETFILSIIHGANICTNAEAEGIFKTIMPGDMLYISNIYPYPYRHPDGASRGVNVVYLGKNEQNEHEFGGLFLNKKPYTPEFVSSR